MIGTKTNTILIFWRYAPMERNQMLCFKTVARTQNISRAAKQLYISQPALSQTIARFEESLGYPLFERVGKKIILNENGKIMLEAIEKMDDIYVDACTKIDEYNQKRKQEVAICFECASLHLPNLLEKLKVLSPETLFRISQWSDRDAAVDAICLVAEACGISQGDTDHINGDNINRHKINNDKINDDIDRKYRFSNDKTMHDINSTGKIMHYEKLLTERILLAVPAGHPLTQRSEIMMDDLAGEELIGLSENWSLGRMVTDQLQRFERRPDLTICLDNPSLVRSLLKKGMGIGFVPEMTWRGFARDHIVLRQVRDFDLGRNICIAYREDKYLTEAERTCIDGIRDYFKTILADVDV